MNGLALNRARYVLSKLLQISIALMFGFYIGQFIGLDSMFGFDWQREWLGAAPPLINDLPFVWSGLGILMFCLLGGLLAWVRQSGGWETPTIALICFSLFADAIPGLYQLSLILVLLVLADRLLRGERIDYRPSPLLIPLLMVVLVYLATFLKTRTPGAAVADFNFRMMFLLAVPLMPALISRREHLRLVIRLMLGAASVSALIGIAQLVISLLTDQLLTFGDPEFNRIGTPLGTMPRCTGLMLHPNQQSNVLGATAILSLWFACGPKDRLFAPRKLLLGCYVLLSLGVLVTFSRSGWLALGVASLLVPLFRWRSLAFWYSALLIAAGIVAWKSGLLEWGFAIVRDMNASSADFRWHIDHLAIEAFQSSPWFGVGVGGILDFHNPYHLEIHNTYLQILAETGIFGSISFALLGLLLGMRLLSRMRKRVSANDWEFLMAFAVASAVLLVQNMVVMFLWVKFLWVWIAFMEASVFVSFREQESLESAA